MRKPDLAFWSITIISACLYAYLGYWVERYEHTELIVSYIILFAAYLVSSRYSIKISFRNLFHCFRRNPACSAFCNPGTQ